MALRSARREEFCTLVASGVPQGVAARRAGYKAPSVQAAQMMRQVTVINRIAELSERMDAEKAKQVIQALVPTREWVLRELVANVDRAKEAMDRGSVNKGLELVGKELGMFVQRSMVIESPLQRLSADKLLALLAIVEEAVGGSDQVRSGPGAIEPRPVLTGRAEPETQPSVGSSVGTEGSETNDTQ